VKRDRPYLQHIIDAIDSIRKYTRDGRDAFMRDAKTQDAVIRKFEVIGEATKRLTAETKARRPDIAWREIAGLRDVLIHNYMGVNLKRVWGVVEHRLQPLREAIQELLNQD
jgi:uncharacterized protein with HEPN domain